MKRILVTTDFSDLGDLAIPAAGELASKLGAAGRRYVDGEYRWNVVLGRYRALIDAVAGS